MKCYSVHIKLGVLEGIALPEPGSPVLIVGNQQPPANGNPHHKCIRVKHPKSRQNASRIFFADIGWERYNVTPIKVGPYKTKHVLKVSRGSGDGCALVMVGTFSHRFHGIRYEDGAPVIIEQEYLRRRKSPVKLICYGTYLTFVRRHRVKVKQRLFRMRKRTSLVLVSECPQTEGDIVISWDGKDLCMVRLPPLCQPTA